MSFDLHLLLISNLLARCLFKKPMKKQFLTLCCVISVVYISAVTTATNVGA